MKVSFLYLDAFSDTGGIQAFNRNFLRACHDIALDQNIHFCSYSFKDRKEDLVAFDNIRKKTAEGSKIKFVVRAFLQSCGANKILLAHFNLVFPLAILLRLFSPRSELIVIAHGVEAWDSLSLFKRFALRCCDRVLAVSNFTKDKLIATHGLHPDKITIFPNTLDPEFRKQSNRRIGSAFENQGARLSDKIIFTLCRLSIKEKRKGYETIIRLLPTLLQTHPTAHYILAGKEEDNTEKKRLVALVKKLNLEKYVTINGYLSNEEVTGYYAACDVFVMPSTKEGFGIVFLEALAFGKPVIAGNSDGSTDALQDGRLGILVNPANETEILKALGNVLSRSPKKRLADAHFLMTEAEKAFGFNSFRERTKTLFIMSLSAAQNSTRKPTIPHYTAHSNQSHCQPQ